MCYSPQTTWGSRAGADASDSERMRKITEAKSSAIFGKSSLVADEMTLLRQPGDLLAHVSTGLRPGPIAARLAGARAIGP